jgi:hypothetical protein
MGWADSCTKVGEVRREEHTASRLNQILRHGESNGEPFLGRSPSAEFIDDDHAVLGNLSIGGVSK